MDRRAFLKGAATAAAAIPLNALVGRIDAGERRPWTPAYGPLVPTLDETTGLPLLSMPVSLDGITRSAASARCGSR